MIPLKPSCSSAAARSGVDRSTRPFAALPHDIAGRPDVSPTEKAVLLALLFWARDKAVCWPSDSSIGQRIGRCPGTVQRALKRLEQLGLIERRKAANVTGREIVLVWRRRATLEAPARGPLLSPARDKWEKEEKSRKPRTWPAEGPAAAETGGETEADVAELRRMAECGDLPPAVRRMAASALGRLGPAHEQPAPMRHQGGTRKALETAQVGAIEPAALPPVDPPAVATRAEVDVDRFAGDTQLAPVQSDGSRKPVGGIPYPALAPDELRSGLTVGAAGQVDGNLDRGQRGIGPAQAQQRGRLLEDRQQLIGRDRAGHGTATPWPRNANQGGSLQKRPDQVSAARPAGRHPGRRAPWVEALAEKLGTGTVTGRRDS
ncbi:MAG: helix-turn-helix domain-containing protein [Isosphaeraceae bacterium]|nr:helix-turn-helix domain-containing protein [Isosphaeraceae bacterium]